MFFSSLSSADSRPPTRSNGRVVYFDGARSVVEGLKSGDPAALENLYDNYAAYIRTILARILGTHNGDADDCLQETFTNAFYRASGLKNPDVLKTWLTRIAICAALDRLRKKKRERWLQFRSPDEVPDIPIPAHRLEDKEALQAVYRIFEAIPEKERVPYTLRQMEKMPLAEIAAVTGTSLATAKRRIAAGAKRFEALAERCAPLENWLNANGQWRSV